MGETERERQRQGTRDPERERGIKVDRERKSDRDPENETEGKRRD